MTINARKPVAAFFGHFSAILTWLPFSAIFYLTAIFAIFRPLSAWLPRCSWCLTRRNRWLLFCMKSFMTLFFRPFFCHFCRVFIVYFFVMTLFFRPFSCHFCRVFYSLFFRPFSIISTRPPFSYIYFYFEQLASNAMAGLRPNL